MKIVSRHVVFRLRDVIYAVCLGGVGSEVLMFCEGSEGVGGGDFVGWTRVANPCRALCIVIISLWTPGSFRLGVGEGMF